MKRLSPSAVTSALVASLLAVLVLAGCDFPEYPGPQLQDPPPGFLKASDSYLERRMFPELEVVHHDAWANAMWGDVSMIYINGHPGRLTRAHVAAALEEAKAAAVEPITFGDVLEYTIDGRPAWGWTERFHTNQRGLVWIAFRVAIPYDTITYALELDSGDPKLKIRPDTLIEIAQVWGVGVTTVNKPLVGGIVFAVIFLYVMMKQRAQKKAERMRSIHFVQIPKEEEKEVAEGEEEGRSGGGLGGGSTAPGSSDEDGPPPEDGGQGELPLT